MSDEPSFTIHGKTYPIPVELNMGELADAEEITGQGYDLNQPGAKATLALAYLAVKRVNPSVTVDEIRALHPSDVVVNGGDVEIPPASDAVSNESGEPSTESS